MKWRVLVVALVVGAVTASAGLRAAPTGAHPSSNPFTAQHGHVMPAPGESILTLLPSEIQRSNVIRLRLIRAARAKVRVPDRPVGLAAVDPNSYCNDPGCYTPRVGDGCPVGVYYGTTTPCLRGCRMGTCFCEICGWYPNLGFTFCLV